ncbi:hypothetical protein [Raineyella sp. LH-20]|uniref:hypothetical protein n=1 Tax=Raineyella sp. LH-20 TaxID=3081204 RepID=UPI00295351E6|nr:hypothetical protein [Raineyella sp. LH-20]WOP17506.1 hypothetical protein R0146_09470 [Raineyella sp. LH-20]
MDVLGVVEGTTSWGELVKRSQITRTARFLDLTVNGVPLRDQVGTEVVPPDNCTPLRSEWLLSEGLAWLDQLADPHRDGQSDGRVALFVCGLCGDPDDGVMSVEITRADAVVHWRKFGWENWEPGVELVDGAPEFSFAAEAYDEVLQALRVRVIERSVEIPVSGHLWWKTERRVVIDV